MVEEGDDQRHHDHSCRAVHCLLIGHGRARFPVCKHQAQRYRLEGPVDQGRREISINLVYSINYIFLKFGISKSIGLKTLYQNVRTIEHK